MRLMAPLFLNNCTVIPHEHPAYCLYICALFGAPTLPKHRVEDLEIPPLDPRASSSPNLSIAGKPETSMLAQVAVALRKRVAELKADEASPEARGFSGGVSEPKVHFAPGLVPVGHVW